MFRLHDAIGIPTAAAQRDGVHTRVGAEFPAVEEKAQGLCADNSSRARQDSCVRSIGDTGSGAGECCAPERRDVMRWLRAACVWLLLMAAEVVHGIARTIFLAPAVGDFRARQLAVFSGSVLILAITSLTIRWMQIGATRSLAAVGLMWVTLTLAFEVGIGRLASYSWARIASDYNLLQGGLLPIGLTVMALSPWIAARLRGVSTIRGSSQAAC